MVGMKQSILFAVAIAVVAAVIVGGMMYVFGFGGLGSGGSGSSVSCPQSDVSLGSTSGFAVLAGSSIASTGATSVTGNLGLSPGTSVTGFPPGTVSGAQDVANSAAVTAKADLTTAYNDAKGRSNCAVSVAGNIGGQTLTPGLYKSTSSLAISSGDLTLNGQGNSSAVFIFQVASSLTTTSGRSVILTNGAQASNVFWVVESSATLGTTSSFAGTILAYASISMDTGATLDGQALAMTGGVTMQANTVTVP
jgi:hypothetical protein